MKKKSSKTRAERDRAERAAAAEAAAVARREHADAVLRTVSAMIETLMSSSPETGYCLLDFYGQITDDPIVSAFARGALQHRVAAMAAEVTRNAKSTSAEPSARVVPNGPGRTASGKTYDWHDWINSGGLQ